MLFVNRYDWIALLDVDEVIVPRKHNSWAEMMAEVGPHTQRPHPLIFQKQFSTFLGESTGQGSLPLVFQKHLLPGQHDGKSAGTKTPQGCSPCTAHDEPCVQVFSQTTSSASTLMQERQLHTAGALYQVLSQHRACSYPS